MASLWTERVGPRGVALLGGAAAGEKAFKAGAPGRRALHLATHGFFLDGGPVSPAAGSRGIGRVVVEGSLPPPSAVESPLQLSGLALAGANRRALAPPEEEDGILTAEEIAGLDLSEGVFGLRRAFQVAGVRTLILSLWQVEDRSARRWMRALYQARLTRGLSTAEAARAASLEVLEERRKGGQSLHPFYWAGFIAAGDWK